MRARRDVGSLPGRRDDAYRVGLAVEGGGMRGVVSGAMLTALRDMGYADAFDAVYAFSAGAINSAYFVAGGGWEALSVYYDNLVGTEFIDPWRAVRGLPVISMDFVIDEVLETLNPLDYDAALSAHQELHVVVSSVNTLRPRTVATFTGKEHLRTILRATCCLPVVGGPLVPYDDDLLLDGGVLRAHPMTTAIDDGCTHVVVIGGQPGRPPRPRPSAVERFVAFRLEHARAGLGGAFLATMAERADVDRLIDRAAAAPDNGPPFLLGISCDPGAHEVGRFTRDRGKLLQGLRAGYSAAVRTFEERPVTTFLRPTLR